MVKLEDGARVGLAKDGHVIGRLAFDEAVRAQDGLGLAGRLQNEQVHVRHPSIAFGVVQRLENRGAFQGQGPDARLLQPAHDPGGQRELPDSPDDRRAARGGESRANLGRPGYGCGLHLAMKEAGQPLLPGGGGEALREQAAGRVIG